LDRFLKIYYSKINISVLRNDHKLITKLMFEDEKIHTYILILLFDTEVQLGMAEITTNKIVQKILDHF